MNATSLGNLETNCRFAALLSKMSDEDDEDDSSNTVTQGSAKTSKNTGSENSGKSKKKKKRKKNKGKNDQALDDNNSEEVTCGEKVQDWAQWKDRDEQYVLDQFQKDLEAALEASRNDLIGGKNLPGQSRASSLPANRKERRKGQQKVEKPVSMSLDEFVSGPVAVDKKCPDTVMNGHSLSLLDDFDLVHTYTENQEKPTSQPAKTKSSKKKNKNKVEVIINQGMDSSTQVEQKKVLEATEEDERQAEFVKNVQIQDKLEKTSAELEELRSSYGIMKAELSQVKKRNKQLCHILGQGEMREKSELLLQIEDLNEVKDELTLQVSQLHAELEQERSKLHAARMELTKFQYGQSGAKSRQSSVSAS